MLFSFVSYLLSHLLPHSRLFHRPPHSHLFHLLPHSRCLTSSASFSFSHLLYHSLNHSYILNILSISSLVHIRHRQALDDLDVPPQLLQGLARVVGPQLGALLVGDEHKVVRHEGDALVHAVFLRHGLVDLAQIDDERRLDAKDGIRGLVRVVSEVEGTGSGQTR